MGCNVFHCARVDKEDEMTCLIKGCNFVLRNIPREAFVYAKHADSEFRFQNTQHDIFPYLLINIGSGVSIVKVTIPELRHVWPMWISLFLFHPLGSSSLSSQTG